ncbi:MAG: hypothetical protein EON61_04110 [Alphaproteobacteria bacterium]|nr:MAG: hypothetical protein EON61_04110 [Alphaproteobacteria bacterium]
MNAWIRLIAAALLSLYAMIGVAFATNVCAAPGRDGIGVSITGVVNTYWASTASASAGATSIVLGSSAGASAPIATGDLVLIIQMQDAQFNSTNTSSYGDGVAGGVAAGFTALNQSGVYEFVRAASNVPLAGGTLNLVTASGGLVNAYAHANMDALGGRGQRRYQVIRVPQYSNASLGAALTAAPWDGTRGGVLAIDVAARLDLAGGAADVTSLGFRGGGGRRLTLGLASLTDIATGSLLSTNGSKGEGIAGSPEFLTGLLGLLIDLLTDTLPGGSSARGAPGNAGGGGLDGPLLFNSTRNSGGGGGAGYGDGGGGGHATCSAAPACAASAQNGGYGGVGVTAMGASRVLLGGGGGAGASDDGSGVSGNGIASSGAPGGGIVIVRAGVVAGTGSLIADGGAANNSVTTDGSGGGGGGGVILMQARQLEAGASVSAFARGGKGGSNSGGGVAHGPGGGGGGGYIASAVAATLNVSGGANGATVNGGAYGTAYGATGGNSGSGTAGLGAGLNLTGLFSGSDCTPVLDKVFETPKITLGLKTRLKVTLTNNNAAAAMTAAGFTDTYPSGMVNAPVPNIATNCGGAAAVTAAAGTNTLQLVSATVPAATSCSVWVDVVPNAVGAYLNTINAGGLTATLVDTVVTTLFEAESSVNVIAPLTATKTTVTISDPQNGTTSPKAVPGAIVEYAIKVENPTNEAVGAMALTDTIPSNSSLVVTDIGAAGSGPLIVTQGTPSSMLTYTFTTLASLTDSFEFSNDNGATWTYAPVAGTGGADANVTTIRAKLTGTHAAGGVFTLKFRVRVK